MNYFPAIFEFLGTTEMLVIALVALIVFGPRKLPEIGRSIGKSLAEFKRASDDFKRTWEREVEMEKIERDLRIDVDVQPAVGGAALAVATETSGAATETREEERSIARAPTPDAESDAETSSDAAQDDAGERASGEESSEPPPKHDWL